MKNAFKDSNFDTKKIVLKNFVWEKFVSERT